MPREIFFRLLILPLALAATLAAADANYEYGMALMDRHDTSFATDDLVERLIAQLNANPANQSEAKLLQAELRRRQAQRASPEKRVALLEEADALLRQVLAGPATFRLYTVAENESRALQRHLLNVKMELARGKPGEAAKLRAGAAAIVAAEVARRKAELDAAQGPFKQALDIFNRTLEGQAAPRGVVAALDAAFHAWVAADQRYINTWIEQLSCYDDADAARTPGAQGLLQHCETRAADGVFERFPVLAAWYAFSRGRVHALLGEEEKAETAWIDALNTASDPEAGRRDAQALRLRVLAGLVKLRISLKKHASAADIVEEELSQNPALMNDESARGIMLDYTRALGSQPDAGEPQFERALSVLQTLAEHGRPESAPAREAMREMAETFALAHARQFAPRLTASQWYNAAYGGMLLGQQEYQRYCELQTENAPAAAAQFERMAARFQAAVECYRRTILTAAGPKCDLLARLRVEPRAWVEMSYCHTRMNNFYEAVIAGCAMRERFAPAARARLIPELEKRKNDRAVAAALAEIDATLMPKAAVTVRSALALNAARHKDLYNTPLAIQIMRADPGLDGAENADLDYAGARADLESAKALLGAAAGTADAAEALKLYERAEASLLAAAGRLMRVTASSRAYESALFQAGAAYARAQALWSAGRFRNKSAELQTARARELAAKAIEIFQRYSEYVDTARAESAGEVAARPERAGEVLLARTSLHAAMQEWEKALQSADAFLLWEKARPAPHPAGIKALYGKFHALLALASQAGVPQGDPLLTNAGETADAIQARVRDDKSYADLLSTLARRYLAAASQARKLPGGADGEAARGYEARVAELHERRLDLMQKSGQEAPLEEYTSLILRLNAAGRKRKAADLAARVLERFDPKRQCMRIPDEPGVWQSMLAKIAGDPAAGVAGVIDDRDLSKRDRCRQDHRTLIDFMYDTREGAPYPASDPRRPECDRFPSNLEKALAQLQTIKNNYKDCQTSKPEFGENGKAYLALIEEEIDFRRRITATRELLSTLALEVAGQMSKDGLDDEVRRYREIANEQLKILPGIVGTTPAAQLKSAELDMLNGKHADALATVEQVRGDADPDSVLYFDASRLRCQALAKLKRWGDAAVFPELLSLAGSKLAPARWPEMQDFLQECYQNGARRPAKTR